MCPRQISRILCFLPKKARDFMKRFLKSGSVVTYDAPFKISAKYTPVLITTLIILSFTNQFFRNVEIDCTQDWNSSEGRGSFGSGYRGRGGYGGGSDSEINAYCYNFETFLVSEALEPEMRGKVMYPGIMDYVPGDKVVKQKYYNKIIIGLILLGLVSFFPLFLWKLTGIHQKIKSMIEARAHSPNEADGKDGLNVVVLNFLEFAGFNGRLGVIYFICKTLALLTAPFNMFYLTGFIGKDFKWYGLDVLSFMTNQEDSWPDPTDVLFPKIAKCVWPIHGGRDLKDATCQLPMNNVTQWSFFFLWWWLVFVFLFNLAHFVYFAVFLIPAYRKFIYRRLAAKICGNNRTMEIPMSILGLEGKEVHNKRILINLSYGDWFMLCCLERNLSDKQFRAIIRQLAPTTNPVFIALESDEATDSEHNLTNGIA